MIRKLFFTYPDGRQVHCGYQVNHQPAGVCTVMFGGGKVVTRGDLQPVDSPPPKPTPPPPRDIYQDWWHRQW